MSDLVFYLRQSLEKQKMLLKEKTKEWERERDQIVREADNKQMRLHRLLITTNTANRELCIKLGIKEGIEEYE